MSTKEAVLNLGYDPTIVEAGRSIRPVFTGTLPASATVSPQYLPPPKAQGAAQHVGSPPSCAAWASTYGLATYAAAAASGQSPSDASLRRSTAAP
jgi:hypothetical protein